MRLTRRWHERALTCGPFYFEVARVKRHLDWFIGAWSHHLRGSLYVR